MRVDALARRVELELAERRGGVAPDEEARRHAREGLQALGEALVEGLRGGDRANHQTPAVEGGFEPLEGRDGILQRLAEGAAQALGGGAQIRRRARHGLVLPRLRIRLPRAVELVRDVRHRLEPLRRRFGQSRRLGKDLLREGGAAAPRRTRWRGRRGNARVRRDPGGSRAARPGRPWSPRAGARARAAPRRAARPPAARTARRSARAPRRAAPPARRPRRPRRRARGPRRRWRG